ncbi:DUF3291 domain-containing protein [Kistimonas scapharcae]|uniref:DUF3291 domain-containing protein n=1 Tax=Kistimonas scapharcae TaxID=1036133 RepID=A0ABP8V360_9GAMM
MSDSYHLAQINIATAKAPLDSPAMKGFVDQLDAINALADNSPGFVWRLQTDDGDATALQVFDDERIIVNISVWESLDTLKTYVYAGDHLTVLKNKKSWFEKMAGPSLALWWIPEGHIPSIADAKAALETLKTKGPSPEAFTFATPFPAPSTVSV